MIIQKLKKTNPQVDFDGMSKKELLKILKHIKNQK